MKNILLIEDNEHIMAINEKYLTDCGYCIEKAYSIREAESVLYHFTPDLIILDIMLPDGDGIDFCESIRRHQNIPILFLTAKTSDKDVISGLNRGGDDYLTKPYDLNVLGSRVRSLLRRSANYLPQESSYQIGPLLLNIVQAQGYVKETNLNLSRLEFGILLYLAQHRGTTVTKEELSNAVWGDVSSDNPAALWTAVSRLKKKIAQYEEHFYIDSDHNGYELVMITDSVY